MRTPRPVLSGCRILLTATRRADDLTRALGDRGAEVVTTPTLGSSPVDRERLIRDTDRLLTAPPDLVVVCTAAGLQAWESALGAEGRRGRMVAMLRAARVVARGPKTRSALEQQGIPTDWIAEAETTHDLVGFLRAEGVQGLRVAVLHAGAVDAGLVAGLAGAGAEVVSLQTYRWVRLDRRPEVLAGVDEAAAGRLDAVVLTSAPGADAWVGAVRRRRALDTVRARVESRQLLLAAVGPVTAERLAFAGLLAGTPATSRIADLVRLVLDRLGDDRHALRTGQGLLRVRAGAITLDHRTVALSPSGLALLRRLASTPGHVVSREELLRVLPGASTDPHAAEVAVARLREALRDATGDGSMVRTVVRRGYVLAAR